MATTTSHARKRSPSSSETANAPDWRASPTTFFVSTQATFAFWNQRP